MEFDRVVLLGLLTALGGGLLIGVDRERRKGEGPNRDAIGLRTCMRLKVRTPRSVDRLSAVV